jgi:hypothetical protein
MSKYLKKYNEKTGKWEIISPTSTDDICVTNTQFNNEITPVSKLTDVLNDIGNDISKLKRNVSWLAEHGGGGGGIGTGNAVMYKVIIMNAGVSNDTLYVNQSKFSVRFKITGGSVNDEVSYRIIYDGNYINNTFTKTKVNTNITINIDNIDMYSQVTPHTFIIEAIDNDGITIPSYTLSIIETSIKVSCKDTHILTIGENGVFDIFVTNKILGSDTNIKIINTNSNNKEYNYSYHSTNTAETLIPIDFYKNLVDEATISVGNTYTLRIEIQASTSDGTPINGSPIFTKIMIQGSNKIVINLQDLTTVEDYDANNETGSEFATGGNITFAFTPYLIDNLTMYYAVQLKSATNYLNIIDIAGYYDLIDHNTGEPKLYTDNQSMSTGKLQTISWNIPNNESFIGEWLVQVKCWSSTGLIVNEKIGKCRIINANFNTFPTQIPIRSNNSTNGNTQYAFWDLSNIPSNNSTSKVWTSRINNYLPHNYTDENTETTSVTTVMNIHNTNGKESGFNYAPSMYLRLSSEAYATIDDGFDKSWADKDGFTISLTFKTDFHPYNDRTVFLLGEIDSDTKEFYNGMKIDLENVYWYFTSKSNEGADISHKMKVPIRQNTLNTVDFVYTHKKNSNGENEGMAKIFINGKIYSAVEAHNYMSRIPSTIYLGCACLDSTNLIYNYSDVNISSLRIFSKALNDMQIVINSHNARAERDNNNNILGDKYEEWKQKNYFKDNEENIPKSSIYDLINNKYEYTCPGYAGLTGSNPPLPVLWLDGSQSTFTREMYESTSNDANITALIHSNFKMYYYDPNALNTDGKKGKHVESDHIGISIQGTSTTTLRSKNLEMYFQEKLNGYTDERTALFQPKDDWFPESQFTLKADVVDSSHANNATLGKWINTYGKKILDDTPPMTAVKNNPPQDAVKDVNGEKIIFENKQTLPTVKHTLEGFQIILMITFANETSPEMLGIYSFNLGRYSYYNMGLSFFKSFSRRTKNELNGEWVENNAPAVIRNYEYYQRNENFEGINLNEIFSFEFGSDADENNIKYNTWSQDNLSILKHIGKFRFNGVNGDDSDPSDKIWSTLQRLFYATARMPQASGQYTYNGNSYTYTGQDYTADLNMASEYLVKRLSIKNAIAYFIIANAFGMVDSLGKNLTLRSWNASYGSQSDDLSDVNKWYPCFYDMDTALGLTNAGDENVSPTVYIDKYENGVIDENNPVPNNLIITRNSQQENGFGAYNSKLWNIFRTTKSDGSPSDFVSSGKYLGDLYEATWHILRQEDSPLSNQDLFIDMFTEQTKDCGELLYNLDYNVKYLTKYTTFSGAEAYGNIEMLHGDRVEYIRNWLKDRFYYLDGIFEVPNTTDNKRPYYVRGYITCGGPEGGGYPSLTLNTTSPTILTVEIGQNGQIFKYYLPSYKDTKIIIPSLSSDSKRIGINSTTLLTKIDGLKDIRFQKFESMSLPKFSQIDLSNIKTLTSNNPVDFDSVFITIDENGKTSDIRNINLYNANGTESFPVTVNAYNKIKRIDIRNSCVTSLSLPSAPLSELLFSNSEITTLTIDSQPYLSELDFTNCSKLQTISLNKCQNIQTLNINSLPLVTEIKITNCEKLTTIKCTNNKELKLLEIDTCKNLKEINLSNCMNNNLIISIKSCNNLINLNLNNVKTAKDIILPTDVSHINYLNLEGCTNLTGFKFGDINSKINTYNGENVLDLRNFTSLNNLNVKNCSNVKYIKFNNIKESPYKLSGGFFSGCNNLKKVFGNISLNGNSIFYGCSNFYINELPDDEITPMPELNMFHEANTANDGNVTNITIDTNNLTNCFSYTKCNLYDVYYILQKCDNVQTLNNAFSYCKNIKTSIKNSLNRDIFSHCTNVTNMSSLFYDSNLNTILYSPKIDNNGNIISNGIFTPCKSLTTINNTFSGKYYMDDKLFYKCNSSDGLSDMKITNISSFSPQIIKDSNDVNLNNSDESTIINFYGYADSNNLLTYLPYLTTLSHSFNSSNYYFNNKNYILVEDNKKEYYTDLFYNNINLKTIDYSFNNINGKGCIRNLFGGYKTTIDDKKHFPQNLVSIKGSFIFNGNSVEKTQMYIGNSFLQKIKHSIEYITDQKANNVTTNTSSFNGNSLEKFIDLEGDDSVTFPYEIFKGCTKLKECPALFRNLQKNSSQSDDITLPFYYDKFNVKRSMFEDTVSLTNISYLFSEMKIHYTLEGKGFKNCPLINVHGIFSESANNGYRNGEIPYGLFYQESENSYKSPIGITEDEAKQLGITGLDYGIENCIFDLNGKVILKFDNDGKIISSKTKPDGNILEYELDEQGYLTETKANEVYPIPTNTIVHNGKYKTHKTTIKDMGECFKYSSSPDLKPYSCDIDEIKNYTYDATNKTYNAGDLVIDNDNYNPIKYYINPDFDPRIWIYNEYEGDVLNPKYDPRRILKNENYDPYKKKWNKWIADGSEMLTDAIKESPLYKAVENGENTDLPIDLPDELKKEYVNADIMEDDIKGINNERIKTRNYICSPDLFRYCKNDKETNIDGIFDSCSGPQGYDFDYAISYGIYGTIPPYLFEPITQITSLNKVFYNCCGILPYKWGTQNSEGIMYPPDLFSKLKNLENISYLFAYCRIYNRCKISETQFSLNDKLTDVSHLFHNTMWDHTNIDIKQIPDSIFNSNKYIKNVSYMFCTDESHGMNRLPHNMGKEIFDINTHKKISNCSYFMFNGKATNGSVPEFWQWPSSTMLNFSKCYYNINNNITNYNDIPETYK